MDKLRALAALIMFAKISRCFYHRSHRLMIGVKLAVSGLLTSFRKKMLALTRICIPKIGARSLKIWLGIPTQPKYGMLGIKYGRG